jgi:tryptophanyl-tRNA synthetase
MRPTGKLHLGNYMGALANWVKLQDEYECYFFIADLHALTTDYADTSKIAPNTMEVALDFLAAGLDPGKCTIFVQSMVKQHYELPLLLGMITPLGWLERVPSYKEMQENLANKDLTTFGFLGYPLLMASDILLYRADFVPVGQDQIAHVELTREVARRFNFLYGTPGTHSVIRGESGESTAMTSVIWGGQVPPPDDLGNMQVPLPPVNLRETKVILPEPDVLLTPSPKLPGTDGRKMSKSYGNTIMMTDPEPVVRQKLKTMVTDPARIRRTDAGDPDKCPVGDLHKVFSPPETMAKVYDGCRSAGIGCIECKGWAADGLVQVLQPIQARRASFSEQQVKEILEDGSRRARARAEKTMVEVRAAMQMTLAGESGQYVGPVQK